MPLGKRGAEQASLTKTLETTVRLLKPGSLIAGKYRILEELGRGGMGIVYKVEDTQLKRIAALKFLSPDSTAIPAREKRLAQEAQTASALNHPNICTIYEVGEAEGNSYIAMEYVDGRPLDRMIPPADCRRKMSCASAARSSKPSSTLTRGASSIGTSRAPTL